MADADAGFRLTLVQARAVDDLIDCWSNWELSRNYYVTVLVPQIVATSHFDGETDRERNAVSRIRALFQGHEWASLADIIDERRPSPERARILREQAQREREREELERAESVREEDRRQGMRRREEARLRAHRERAKSVLLTALRDQFDSDYLGSEQWLIDRDSEQLVSHDELRVEQANFTKAWCAARINLPLDSEQALAVSATGGHFKVAARAGSGKTRTLEARALFLMLHCGVPADQIMVLAFNKAAAEEVRKRIKARLQGGEPPFCFTFHALAYRLVHPGESILMDEGELNRSQSRRVQRCIDELVRSPIHHLKIRKLMMSLFRDEWNQIKRRGDLLAPSEAVEARRHLKRETLKGDYVKSQGERSIANALLEHGVEYKYERTHDWAGFPYRPDFSILIDRKVEAVIEFFGMQGNRKYDKTTEEKIDYWSKRPNVLFIPLYPNDVQEPNWENTLKRVLTQLRTLGPKFQQLSDDEIWKQVKERAIGQFTTTVLMLVSRARQRGWDSQSLMTQRGLSDDSEPADLFIALGSRVLSKYEQALGANNEEDFTGLMWRAVEQLQCGNDHFESKSEGLAGNVSRLRHIMIDEFQDFSQMFAELTQQMAAVSPEALIFAVGDDWQAINEFAGSDLKYFNNFVGDFDGGTELSISRNYRSARSVVDRGNQLMKGRGTVAEPASDEEGWVGICDLAKFTPNLREKTLFHGDQITPALLRVVANLIESRREVVLLARRHDVWWVQSRGDMKSVTNIDSYRLFLLRFLSAEAEDLLRVSTAHGFKGQEADAVIILNADANNFPFIHPTLELFRIFGDGLETALEAERRLFYVATTRAKERLLYLYDSTRGMSDFVASMDDIEHLAPLDLNKFSGLSSGDQIEIRVFVPRTKSPPLKEAGLRWVSRGAYWSHVVNSKGIDLNGVQRMSWFSDDQQIEICNDRGEVIAEIGPTRGTATPRF